MGMTTVYAVDHVSVIRDGRYLVEDVSFTCDEGANIALIGPNGAGKSTVLKLLAGDIAPDNGEIRFFGKLLPRYRPVELARYRAVLPQQTVIQFAYRVEEIVAMGRAPLPPASREDEEAAVDAALAASESLHLRERIFPQLSGGEQGRVSLSRVLAQETPVLLLDEPTAALDVRHQHQIMQVANRIAEEGGTVISVIHDLNLAFAYATRIGVMHEGRLVAFDTPWGIAKTDLLSDVFDFPLHVMRHPAIPHPLVVPLNCELPTTPNTEESLVGPMFGGVAFQSEKRSSDFVDHRH